MLRLCNVSLKAKGALIPLVHNISLQVQAGETLALMGPSGSGKSLTAMAVAGFLPNNISMIQGQVHIQENKNVALIMQNPADCFDPLFTLGWVFRESFSRHVPRADVAHFTHTLLCKVGFTDPKVIEKSYPFELSGGMLHRCMMALALGAVLCGQASCVVADEPLSGLDTPSRGHMLKLLRQLQEEYGFALLYIDHDLASAAQVASHVAIMAEGRMVEYGTLERVLQSPEHEVTKAMVKAYERLHSTAEQDSKESTNKTTSAQTILQAQHVCKTYGNKKVLQDICLHVQAGQSLGLVGANGAGKSTLIRVLLGLEDADGGDITCLGSPIKKCATKAAWRRDLQAVFQHARLAVNPRMQARDILLEPLRAHKLDFPLKSTAEQDAKVAELLALVELPVHFSTKYPAHMSGGQLQRLCLARALALQPKVVLLDESLADLDAVVAEQLQKLLLRLKKQLSLCFLYISHDITSVLRLCDTITVLQEGCIVDTFASENYAHVQRHEAFMALLPPKKKSCISLKHRLCYM